MNAFVTLLKKMMLETTEIVLLAINPFAGS